MNRRFWLFGKLIARILLAAFLVFGTYNPSGRSYWDWARSGAGGSAAWFVVATGLLLVAYAVVLPAVLRALGLGGIALVTSLATVSVWVMIEADLIRIADVVDQVWMLLSVVAFVLGVGLCWMTIGRTLDGQARTRDLTR